MPSLPFVMLNPSTADDKIDDPTIRRCVGFAHREGFGGIEVVNLFALRSANPKALVEATDPFGPDNEYWLKKTLRGVCIAAWGAHKQADMAVEHWRDLLRQADMRCLGMTAHGAPRHPLYLRSDAILSVWTP